MEQLGRKDDAAVVVADYNERCAIRAAAWRQVDSNQASCSARSSAFWQPQLL